LIIVIAFNQKLRQISQIISYDLDIFKASLLASSYFSTNSNTDFIGAQLAKSIHTNDKSLEITPTIAACRISIFLSRILQI
jgi:hypothetical protein